MRPYIDRLFHIWTPADAHTTLRRMTPPPSADATDRTTWVHDATRMALPVLSALSAGKLKASMAVEHSTNATQDRRPHTHLEAFGRLMAGISPWLASDSPEPQRKQLAEMAILALDHATNPASPDFMNYCDGGQSLVDTAFLSQAILRAPSLLWQPLDAAVKRNVIAAIKSSRVIKPGANNWLLFSATVEAFLAMAGEAWDAMRVDYALQQHEQWFKGDGAYGDGPYFHWDYYNSFVIHPMMLDVVDEVGKTRRDWDALAANVKRRSIRMATVLERLIATDGSFPPIGRSLAYRGGAFQLLAQVALQNRLPENLPPAQVRTALSAVLRRTLDAPGTYDDAGWLRIGLCGHQPSIGEGYICTGSLYLASMIFLPLGLPEADPFWADAPQPFTQQKIWSGVDVPPDKAV
ncbi:MAG: hypothetical protein JWM57_2800 [Phycisphaerales bacterium]|nr:hypothetical protein [Phycisphaerales bacterium]